MVWRKNAVVGRPTMLCSTHSGYSVYLAPVSLTLYRPNYCAASQTLLMDDDDSVILESARLRHHWRPSTAPR